MATDIMIAKVYNSYTGASVTHRDIRSWGYLETAAIIAALELVE